MQKTAGTMRDEIYSVELECLQTASVFIEDKETRAYRRQSL